MKIPQTVCLTSLVSSSPFQCREAPRATCVTPPGKQRQLILLLLLLLLLQGAFDLYVSNAVQVSFSTGMSELLLLKTLDLQCLVLIIFLCCTSKLG